MCGLQARFKPHCAEREHVDEAEDVGAENNNNLAQNHRNLRLERPKSITHALHGPVQRGDGDGGT